MQKLSGIHFYINIINFNEIILDEETKTNNVTHSIHALDTFFTTLENYGKNLAKNLVIEKITGSRLHLYVTGELLSAFQIVKTISALSYKLAAFMNTGIPKYRSLKDFSINIGVAYGQFYDFELIIPGELSESTTIGYAANYAAKLQSLSEKSRLSVSENIFNALPVDEQKGYIKIDHSSVKKYGQDKFYTISLAEMTSPISITDVEMEAAKEYANSANLGDISYSSVRGPLNYRDLNRVQCKRLEGIPVFADIRGFTSQFDEDDSNLDAMAQKTQAVLTSMYRTSTDFGGIHIQFQGDRELSLFHNIPGRTENGVFQQEQKCYKKAVVASMRLIDAVKPYNVHIGVGEDFGRLFATKIGARGEKDNILLGETVINADKMEDGYAGEDQIAITPEVYFGLKSEDSFLANQFNKVGNVFVTTVGYGHYLQSLSFRSQSHSTSQNGYNGAWGSKQ